MELQRTSGTITYDDVDGMGELGFYFTSTHQ